MKSTWIPPESNSVPITTLIEMNGRDDERIKEALGYDTFLAHLIPGFSYREAQHRIAQHSLRALGLRKHLLAEAGTGIGKSFGVLLPSIEHAKRTKKPVLVSTATNALLDQYKAKDLPTLQRVLEPWLMAQYGSGLTWAGLKGRTNYHCPMADSDKDLSAYEDELEEIDRWLGRTETGDLSELKFEINQDKYYDLKASVTSDSDECPGRAKCAMGDSCHYYKAKDNAAMADVVVVNHALVGIDLFLGRQLLPEYGAIVIDEAHQFVRYVQSAMEQKITKNRFYRLTKKLVKMGLDARDIHDLAARWFAALQSVMDRTQDDRLNLRNQDLPQELWQARDGLLIALDGAEGRLVAKAADEPRAEALARSCQDLRRALGGLDVKDANLACWVERSRGRDGSKDGCQLHTIPVDVSKFLQETLWKTTPGVLTSATLATGRGEDAFTFVKREFGLPGHPLEMQVESPFNWEKQALYVFPGKGYLSEEDWKAKRGEPYWVGSKRWAAKAWRLVLNALRLTKGRAFVLCTSVAVCNELYEQHMAAEIEFPAARQGIMSKTATVDWFKSTPNPVLYATSSYWEGVDVPGDQLSLVVIDKIPFPNGSDPLEQAKMERFGREAFAQYQIPWAITALKQGVGRLIRTTTDTGVLVMLDPRFHAKGYGKTIARALPGDAERGLDRTRTNVSAFLAGYSPLCRPAKTDEEKAAEEGLLMVADDDPDRAESRNGVGFSAFDAEFGHDLANQLRACHALTDKQWEFALSLAFKYRKQIKGAA